MEERKIYFLENVRKNAYNNQIKSVMEKLLLFCDKIEDEILDEDVLNFLISKDVDGSGRTMVHSVYCEKMGTIEMCSNQSAKCGRRHAHQSLRVGYVEKMKRGFDDMGFVGEWNSRTKTGNPARSLAVKRYLDFCMKEQGESGITPKQARVMLSYKQKQLLALLKRKGDLTSSRFLKIRFKRDRAFYATAFDVHKRCDDVNKVVAKNVYKIPNEKGLIFNFTWGKTIRGMVHVFGMMCICDSEPDLCAVCSIEDYVNFAKEMGWSFRTGYLFLIWRCWGLLWLERQGLYPPKI